MANILVIAFDNPDEAVRVAATMKELRGTKAVHLLDMRVVVKDAEGNLSVKDEAGHPVAAMAALGGVLGAILFITFPVLGAAVGAGMGAGVAKWAGSDLDQKFIHEVAASLQPNTSELFLLGTALDAEALLRALKQYKGTVIQTTVSSQDEERLKQALGDFGGKSQPQP